MGASLFSDRSDFRLEIFDQQTLDDRARRGVVCLVRGDFLVTRKVEERSTNEWRKVSDVLHSIGMLNREKSKPQIRLIQRNAILQSSIYPSARTANGYSSEFLEQRLDVADTVIVCLRTD